MEAVDEETRVAETRVYWDVVDFPVTDIESVKENIIAALGNEGYRGNVSITAYGGEEPLWRHQYEAAGITFVSSASKARRIRLMLLDIHLGSLRFSYIRDIKNVMVIAKRNVVPFVDDEDPLLAYYLDQLDREDFNLLLAVPPEFQPEMIPRRLTNSVWLWSELCAGGKPQELKFPPLPRPPPPDKDNPKACSLCGRMCAE